MEINMETTKHIFTFNEKKCLRDIVKKYYAIVENKDIHTAAVRQKNATWQQIGEEYNACPHVSFHATPKQLRRLWLNLKQRSKAKTQRYFKKDPDLNGTSMNDTILTEDPLRSEILQNEVNEFQNSSSYRDQQEENRKSEKHAIEFQILKEQLREDKAKADLGEENRKREKHALEVQILKEQLREAKMKADLAELLYNQQLNSGTVLVMEENDQTNYK